MKQIVVIDYGICNVDSVSRAVAYCGAKGTVTDRPEIIMEAAGVILPGVGSFAEGMIQLEKKNITSVLKKKVKEQGAPFLGICLGMHLMASLGTEGGIHEGLDLIPGVVNKLTSEKIETKIPHVGWNEVKWLRDDPILFNIPDNTDFYFVHSYYFKCDEQFALGKTFYCNVFPSVVAQGKCYGTQFHPEKSQRMGLQLLKNFIQLC